MIPLQSKLEQVEGSYSDILALLKPQRFSLGGNWDYTHGSFDRPLDEEQKVWLRLPFTVVKGELDGENERQDTGIRFQTPLVLRHLYNDGLDDTAPVNTYGALVNQFQAPVDPDAPVADEWVEEAKRRLQDAEAGILQ